MTMKLPIARLLVAALLITASVENSNANDPVLVASGSAANAPKQPQVAVGLDGSVHLVYGIGDTVQYARSSDGGVTFEKSLTAFRVPNLSLGMRRGPRIVTTESAIVVTAIGGRMGKGRDGDLLAWRSTDHGKSWQGPSQVNDAADSAREGLHAMASGTDNSIWCVWLDLRDRKSEIYVSVSKDNGATWEANRCIYRSPDGSVCECCHPSVIVKGRNVHVMFRNSVGGNRDMYVTTSADGGNSFSDARKLGSGTWMLDACPMDGGMLAAGSNGAISTVWRRDGNVYAAAGDGSPEILLGRGQQPWIAGTANGSIIVWTAGREGDLLVKNLNSGESEKLSETARDPVIASTPIGDGPVIACWESKLNGEFTVVATRVEVPGTDAQRRK
ncbi:MAG: exo-alpha-sialidase [Planctomyces sp.]|nr:exo-alpha-sialidase [Planctomyces sp.]